MISSGLTLLQSANQKFVRSDLADYAGKVLNRVIVKARTKTCFMEKDHALSQAMVATSLLLIIFALH